ncbi:type II toxin-antitoxin system RelE/ParE family toxin [candidate division KSB1 bacterium]|nr:MAG: type II toxin-antitoxin system RelE/ParE family toxin [candidate division KSB1 bacterium]MBC6951704.1 type II toxin-antitoxin system RelE/ParE family toxin [candidate division KSB1 bacterium]MCE7941353.1 type II toxin-antitoxin system RelE/ParE family toxin [Chlorobi bacterium CHB1]MDL1878992.1 type II toxin-antitoxin system RelE/ParE family toxin [Cytophagia bacterium CHB2]NUM75348.1 type II toxin-antitoxin system RelE/ParE family toxin [candidate division KSB1 bacterium]
MTLEFRKSFARDLKKIKEKQVLQQIKEIIEEVEQAANIGAINNLKQLKGGESYYRIRIGDYRIGLKLENERVVFVRFLHRKEIYRYFP